MILHRRDCCTWGWTREKLVFIWSYIGMGWGYYNWVMEPWGEETAWAKFIQKYSNKIDTDYDWEVQSPICNKLLTVSLIRHIWNHYHHPTLNCMWVVIYNIGNSTIHMNSNSATQWSSQFESNSKLVILYLFTIYSS